MLEFDLQECHMKSIYTKLAHTNRQKKNFRKQKWEKGQKQGVFVGHIRRQGTKCHFGETFTMKSDRLLSQSSRE